MSVSNDSNMKIDLHSQLFVQNSLRTSSSSSTGSGAAQILRQWKREDLLKRGIFWLRAMTFLLSLISVILVASNKHGDWRKFNKYKEYGYFLAISIISILYTGAQVIRQIHEYCIGKNRFHLRSAALFDFDFVGDQVVTYLLISSVSSAIPITHKLRGVLSDDVFADSSIGAISVSFLAFLCLALSALMSGYKLSAETLI